MQVTLTWFQTKMNKKCITSFLYLSDCLYLRKQQQKRKFLRVVLAFLHNEKDKNCLLLCISVSLHVDVFFSIFVHFVLIECSHECRNKNCCYQGFVYVCICFVAIFPPRSPPVFLTVILLLYGAFQQSTYHQIIIDYFICCSLFILGHRIKGLFLAVYLVSL